MRNSDLVDDYVRSLSRVIGNRLSPSTKTARLREAEGHLRMAAAEIGVAEAVRHYGPVRFVAGEMVRVERGYTGTSSGRLALLVSLLIGATMFLQMNRYDLGLSPFFANLLIWTPTLALTAFAIRVGQTRRWLVFSVIPSLVTAWIATLAIGATFAVRSQDLPAAGKYLNTLRREEAVLDRWRTTGEVPGTLFPQINYVSSMSEIPLLPFYIPTGSGFSYNLIGSGLNNDPDGWKHFGKAWAKEFPSRLSEAESRVAWLRKTAFDRFLFGFTPGRLSTATGFILADVLILSLINAFVLGLVKVSDRGPVQRA